MNLTEKNVLVVAQGSEIDERVLKALEANGCNFEEDMYEVDELSEKLAAKIAGKLKNPAKITKKLIKKAAEEKIDVILNLHPELPSLSLDMFDAGFDVIELSLTVVPIFSQELANEPSAEEE